MGGGTTLECNLILPMITKSIEKILIQIHYAICAETLTIALCTHLAVALKKYWKQ